MSTENIFRLNRVHVTNFRCFAECDLELHDRLTVLIADNGRGKSALLDAIGIALGGALAALTDTQPRIFKQDDFRQQLVDGKMETQPEVGIHASGHVGVRAVEWEMSRRHRTRFRFSSELRLVPLATVLEALQQQLTEESHANEALPIFAHYRTERVNEAPSKQRDYPSGWSGRLLGYLAYFSPSVSFSDFNSWYQQTHRSLVRAPVTGAQDQHRPERLLSAVNTAVQTVLEPTGWERLGWSEEHNCLTLYHPVQGELPIARLSDGVRNMAALVADLAHRCVRLNPHLGDNAPAHTSGVVLIDEVDLHLHPSWQQQIVPLLQRAFPEIQFVVTTHSPQVLSTVYAESIRIIKHCNGDGQIEIPRYQTRGVESADVLAKVMGVDPVPATVPEAKWLSDYRAFVQSGSFNTPEAVELWDRLERHFGNEHPLISEMIVLRQFEEFKQQRLQ